MASTPVAEEDAEADRAAADWDAAWAAAMGDAPPGMAAPPSEAGGAVAAAAHEGGSQQSPPRLSISGCGGSPGTTTASTVLTASDWLARGVVAATLLSRDQPVDEDEDEEDEDEGEEVGVWAEGES